MSTYLKKMKTKVLFISVLTLFVAGCAVQEEVINFSQLSRPDRPNNYLVCMAGQCERYDMLSKTYSIPATTLEQHWLDIIKNTPRVNQFHHEPKIMQYHFVQRTKWLRFPDDIYLQIHKVSDNESSYSVYSKARYGYYDFEVNKNRITEWIEQLNKKLAKAL